MGTRSILVSAWLLPLAVPASAETLADAIAQAYRDNPTLGGSRYDVRAADEDIVQARSELRPSLSLSTSGGLNRFIPGASSNPLDPSRGQLYSSNSSQSQIVLVQPLYTGGRATADRLSAEARVRGARAALQGTEGDIILAVITAYVDVRRYEQAVNVWRLSVTELERLGDEIVARQIAGEQTRTDVALARGQISVSRQRLVLAEQALQAARIDYAALVGSVPGTLTEEPPLPQVPSTVEMAYATAEENNPELARALFAEEASRSDASVARSLGQPTVSLRGSGAISGRASPWYPDRQDRGYSATVTLALPLSSGGRVASQVRQAEDRNFADRFRIEEARRALLRDVANAWNQMATSERVAGLLDEQRQDATVQLDGMINEYRVGLRSTFEVLNAQQTLRDAEIATLQSGRDRYVSEATLLRRAGLLEARVLMEGVATYDPSAHVRAVAGRNALPWDGLIAALDKSLAPRGKMRPLERPPSSGRQPAIVAPVRTLPGADAPLAHDLPVASTTRLQTRSRQVGFRRHRS